MELAPVLVSAVPSTRRLVPAPEKPAGVRLNCLDDVLGAVFVVGSPLPRLYGCVPRIAAAAEAQSSDRLKTGVLLAEREMMSTRSRLSVLMAVIVVLASSTVEAGRSMASAEIEATFRGITLDGVYNDGAFFSETYFDDGSIRYHDALGADSGDWSVRGDMFCTFYEGQQGSCFFVVREGNNCFTFFEPERVPGGGIVPRESWTSRGWNREQAATCIMPPEALI
jgi:hypothetical protein